MTKDELDGLQQRHDQRIMTGHEELLWRELAAEVKRREEAERCAAELREERASLAERLRQAERERERDEAREIATGAEEKARNHEQSAAEAWRKYREEKAERRRSEADNAALVTEMTRAAAEARHAYNTDVRDWNLVGSAIRTLEKSYCADHPGVEILERMTHLEEKVEEFARYANEAHAALDEAGLSAGG